MGRFLSGGAEGIVVGTGNFYPSASSTNDLLAVDSNCNLQWYTKLDGLTSSSPALADVAGNGQLEVVEGTNINNSSGSLWVLNGTNGSPIWHTAVTGAVIGSVVTADLTGNGYQDILVPTTGGVQVYDGQSHALVTNLGAGTGFQNSPLVTRDPNGTIGITIAGYNANNQGVVTHYEIAGSNGARVDEHGSWPMFHHDPQLSGNADASYGPPGSLDEYVPTTPRADLEHLRPDRHRQRPGHPGVPSSVMTGAALHVYARGGQGDLIEYVNDNAGGHRGTPTTSRPRPGAATPSPATPRRCSTPTRAWSTCTRWRPTGISPSTWPTTKTAMCGTPMTSRGSRAGAPTSTPPPTRCSTRPSTWCASTPRGPGAISTSTSRTTKTATCGTPMTSRAVAGGGTAVTGQPSTLYNAASGLFHIYARGADGSLYEYDPDHQNGHIWNAYNLSAAAGGGAGTFSAPSAVFQVAQGLVHVYVSGPAGLTEYLPDHQGGHIWNAYSLQAAAGGGGPMSGDPDALYDPNSGLVHVYVRGVGNMLTDYEPDHASGHIWNAYNLSVASGGPAVASDPGAIVIGSTIQVYARARSDAVSRRSRRGSDGRPTPGADRRRRRRRHARRGLAIGCAGIRGPRRHPLSGVTSPTSVGAHDTGAAVAASQPIAGAVALAPSDPGALEGFVRAVSTPGSPQYRHYLARGQFGPRFGAVALHHRRRPVLAGRSTASRTRR